MGLYKSACANQSHKLLDDEQTVSNPLLGQDRAFHEKAG